MWITTNIGLLLRKRRRELGVSVKQMEAQGISHGGLWKVENSKGKLGASVGTLNHIARILECRIEMRLVDEATGEEVL